MKLKKWGALLLVLCMIVMVFPTTAMADANNTSGPLDEKKVIENDLVVQLPSFNELVDEPADGVSWLAVTAEPTWEDGTILGYVHTTQEFYDSTGEKLTAADTFQNNSRYMMKMTFRSFEYYHGDYYYVLSGENNVYLDVYSSGQHQRYPMDVTVDTDVNGNPVITATYSFSIDTPPEEPSQETSYELALLHYGEQYSPESELSDITVNVNDRNEYYFYLVQTNTDGTKTPVDTNLYDLAFTLSNGSQNAIIRAYQGQTFYRLSVSSGIYEAKENLTITAAFKESSKSITRTIPLEVRDMGSYSDLSLAIYGLEYNYRPDRALYNLEEDTPYVVSLVRTKKDGTYSVVDTDLYTLDIQIANGDAYAFTSEPHQLDDGYAFGINSTGDASASGRVIVHAQGAFGSASLTCPINAQEIEANTVYTLSDQKAQNFIYSNQPADADEPYQSYTLWTEGATAEAESINSIWAGNNHYHVFSRSSTNSDPISFQITPTTDHARFELVESKRVTKIEFLSVPDSMIQDIRENGSKANLNGFTFKVTYADGSARTYEYSGKKDDNYFVYHMDWTPDGNIYDCSYDSENNAISILGFKEPDAPTIEYYKIPDESKVNIKEGLSEVTGDLGNTEYNTVEKIENKLTETIVSNEGYIADNTALYDIELVTSEDGGQTWVPVTAENFPAEGIVVTLPYPEGTNAADYDFTVVHMFDEDVNGHKAGEVETPEVTEGENGISFRLTGTSPVMVGYKKVAAAHTHSYGKWTDCKDGINHQRSCSCGDVQKETHVWDDGKVTKEATKDAEGIKTYTCKTCGATKTKSIPKLTSDTTPSKPGDSTNPNTDTTSPKTGDSANIALWIVVMLASAAGLSCTYFVKRKKVNN